MNLAQSATIVSVKPIAKQTVVVTIKVPDDFTFSAGQYIWLMVPKLAYPDSRGNTRMFSIASSPNHRGELDIIFRTSPSGYKKTLSEMPPGAEVLFSGPYGHMILSDNTQLPIVLIAGGVGVAPFLSIIRFLTETHSDHKILLIYANASESSAAYLSELIQLEKNNPNFNLTAVLGVVHADQLREAIKGYLAKKTIWLVTGPQGLVNMVGKYLISHGVALSVIIFEEFYPRLLS